MKLYTFEGNGEQWFEWISEEARVAIVIPIVYDKDSEASIHFVSKILPEAYSDDCTLIGDGDLVKLRNAIDSYLISKEW